MIITIITMIMMFVIMIMLVPALPWVDHLEELFPVVLLFHPIPCSTPLETCSQLLSLPSSSYQGHRHHHMVDQQQQVIKVTSIPWSWSSPSSSSCCCWRSSLDGPGCQPENHVTLVRIVVAMRIIMIFMITVMIILHWWWWLWRCRCRWWRPWQVVSTEQAEDLRRWESGTLFLFFSGPCKPFNIILGNCKEWMWKRAELLNFQKSPQRPPLGRDRGRKHVPRIVWGRAPWYCHQGYCYCYCPRLYKRAPLYCHHWCHHNITNISYRVFFHWYPPKKFKYGKPRLGESTLT